MKVASYQHDRSRSWVSCVKLLASIDRVSHSGLGSCWIWPHGASAPQCAPGQCLRSSPIFLVNWLETRPWKPFLFTCHCHFGCRLNCGFSGFNVWCWVVMQCWWLFRVCSFGMLWNLDVLNDVRWWPCISYNVDVNYEYDYNNRNVLKYLFWLTMKVFQN